MHEFILGVAMQVLSQYVDTEAVNKTLLQNAPAEVQEQVLARQAKIREANNPNPNHAPGSTTVPTVTIPQPAIPNVTEEVLPDPQPDIVAEAAKEIPETIPEQLNITQPEPTTAVPTAQELAEKLPEAVVTNSPSNLFDNTVMQGTEGVTESGKVDFAEILTDEEIEAERSAAEKKRIEEEKKRIEEEKARLEKERRQVEEEKRRRAEEEQKAEQERQRQLEAQRLVEERMRQEEEKKRQTELERQEAARRAEEQRRQLEAQKEAEAKAKAEAEAQAKAEAERKQREAEEQQRLMAERKQQEEEAKRKAEAEAAHKAKLAEEERLRAEEAKRRSQEAEAQKLATQKQTDAKKTDIAKQQTKEVAKDAKSETKTPTTTTDTPTDNAEANTGLFGSIKNFFSSLVTKRTDTTKTQEETTQQTQAKVAEAEPKEPLVVGKHLDWQVEGGKITERKVGDEIDRDYILTERRRQVIQNQPEEIRIITPKKKESDYIRHVNLVPDILLMSYRSNENRHIPVFYDHNKNIELLFDAIRQNDTKMLYSLADTIDDLNQANSTGELAINIAVTERNYEALDFLISRGVRINDTDIASWTPLHYAVVNHNIKAVYLLLSMGADPNIQDKIGRTPLMYAILNKDIKAIYYILGSHKVDFAIVDYEGNNLFSLLRQVNDPKSINLIRYYFSVNGSRLGEQQ